MELHTVVVPVHGRFLVHSGPSERLLIGFHGYAENAEGSLAQLAQIPGIADWTVVAVQALHPFYQSRTGEVVASWMTSQDRDLAIEENLNYVRLVIASLPPASTVVFLGFSQGAAMAYRAAAATSGVSGVIALAGDVPPDVLGPLPPVLIGRGDGDPWYTREKLEQDLRFLEGRAEVRTCEFAGVHEWTEPFREAAANFLRSLI